MLFNKTSCVLSTYLMEISFIDTAFMNIQNSSQALNVDMVRLEGKGFILSMHVY